MLSDSVALKTIPSKEGWSLIAAIPQPQLFRTKWHASKMPRIYPISVMASPKMASLGTFNLGRALA